MLRRIFLKFGPSGSSEPIGIDLATMTIFVGPNNSGKSLVLREIQHYIEQGPSISRSIIDGIEVDLPSYDEAESLLRTRKVDLPVHTTYAEDSIRFFRTNPSVGGTEEFEMIASGFRRNYSRSYQHKSQGGKD